MTPSDASSSFKKALAWVSAAPVVMKWTIPVLTAGAILAAGFLSYMEGLRAQGTIPEDVAELRVDMDSVGAIATQANARTDTILEVLRERSVRDRGDERRLARIERLLCVLVLPELSANDPEVLSCLE